MHSWKTDIGIRICATSDRQVNWIPSLLLLWKLIFFFNQQAHSFFDFQEADIPSVLHCELPDKGWAAVGKEEKKKTQWSFSSACVFMPQRCPPSSALQKINLRPSELAVSNFHGYVYFIHSKWDYGPTEWPWKISAANPFLDARQSLYAALKGGAVEKKRKRDSCGVRVASRELAENWIYVVSGDNLNFNKK